MARFKTSRNKSKRSNKRNNVDVRKQQKVGLTRFSTAEVVDVVLNDQHPDYNPELKVIVGSVKARRLKEEFNSDISTLNYYNPYFGAGIYIPPLIGETVQLVSALGSGAQRDNKSEEMYYLPPLNIWQDVNHNQLPGASYKFNSIGDGTSEEVDCNPSGQYTSNPGSENRPQPDPPVELGFIFEEKEVQRLFPYEGDIILEGRCGHSIRMSSTVKNAEYKNWWSNTGENGDPITIISDDHDPTPGGDYKIEDVNNDGGIVVLACTQIIPIEIISKDGDNIRWDSYDHTPTAKEQNKTELNYEEVIKEEELGGDTEPNVDDREQVNTNDNQEEIVEEEKTPCEKCPDGSIPERDEKGDCKECPETNDDGSEIKDYIFGDAIAHKLANRPGTGKVQDHPDGPFGTSKYLASPASVAAFIRDYPEDQLRDKNVVLSCGLIAHTVDFKPGVVHLTANVNTRANNKIISYEVYETTAREGVYYVEKHRREFVGDMILGLAPREGSYLNRVDAQIARGNEQQNTVGKYTFHDWNRTFADGQRMFKQYEGTPPGPKDKRFYKELVVPKSQLNISQTIEQMINAFTLRGGGGAGNNGSTSNDIKFIKMQLDDLKNLNCTVKLCGIGDNRNSRNGLNFNDMLQQIADEYENVTFIGGYDRDRNAKTNFYPADPEDYRKRVNAGTQATRPNPTPQPDPEQTENPTGYKGFIIEEKSYTKSQVRSTIYSEPADYYFVLRKDEGYKMVAPPGYDPTADYVKEAIENIDEYWEEGTGVNFLDGNDVSPQAQNPPISSTNENYIRLIQAKIDLLEEDHFDSYDF